MLSQDFFGGDPRIGAMALYHMTPFFLILGWIITAPFAHAQNIQIETGWAMGNVAGEKHSLGKAELHMTALKCYNFGQIGLDLATGGNFIPGDRSTIEGNSEILSPNDTKFSSVALVYRFPMTRHIFLEPKLGYASLFSYVHTDDTQKIKQPNFSAGFGFGGYIGRFTLSLRYQYYGQSPSYQGSRDGTMVVSNAESIGMILFRTSFRFGLDRLFKLDDANNFCLLNVK